MMLLPRLSSSGLSANIRSAAALGFVGDIMCQVGVDGRRLLPTRAPGTDAQEVLDVRRVGALTIFNGVYIGAFLHYLYQTYPIVVLAAARRMPARPLLAKSLHEQGSLTHAMGCALLDVVHNNVIYLPTYFIGVGLLQGDGLRASVDNLMREWWVAGGTCTAAWLPFTVFNFSIVPPAQRIQAMASANLVWNVIIDYLAHRGGGAAAD
mmetsp:Transcript_21088/g.51837  ORF Transcript_21088/g.51837 Transcript_21088/m.51837 type:complete len:208 (-) Transcript_21088:234-857(-)